MNFIFLALVNLCFMLEILDPIILHLLSQFSSQCLLPRENPIAEAQPPTATSHGETSEAEASLADAGRLSEQARVRRLEIERVVRLLDWEVLIRREQR